ncbi:MAG TPA: C4-dicarboxylate ABC transporter, partial [Campylobacterales bacterium]|nr:C4-dicarboxylate ABC transporter [Campylobacterales bacterium]
MIEKLLDKLASITSYFLYLLVALIIYDLTNRYLFSSGSIALQEL